MVQGWESVRPVITIGDGATIPVETQNQQGKLVVLIAGRLRADEDSPRGGIKCSIESIINPHLPSMPSELAEAIGVQLAKVVPMITEELQNEREECLCAEPDNAVRDIAKLIDTLGVDGLISLVKRGAGKHES